MKIIFTIFLCLLGISAIAQSEYHWTEFRNPPMISIDNASSITSFDDTPGSMITYFYASRIRKDDKWNEVVPSAEKRSEGLKRKLKEYDQWKFTKFKLVSYTEYSPGEMWVKIYFEVEYQGDKDAGTDEVTMQKINGKWIITSVPT